MIIAFAMVCGLLLDFLLGDPAWLDYVVVHELAHILHKDHSKAFYRTVERFMPDYRRRRAMLKN